MLGIDLVPHHVAPLTLTAENNKYLFLHLTLHCCNFEEILDY